MSAARKRNSSHVWNAILHGREALKRGLIKRPGDGSTIRIWEDPWIPGNFNMRPLVRKPESQAIMVQELIDDEIPCWNQVKLNENFIMTDAAAIRGIPIGKFQEDFWAWSLEKRGYFTVRSCYRKLVELNMQSDQASGSNSQNDKIWKALWAMLVPPKVRTFWWRVIKSFIPCCQVLNHRHMEEIAFCRFCGAEQESVFHAFFECTWACLFWKELKQVTLIKIPRLHPMTWATDLIDGSRVSMEDACVILCGCWAIWNERNAVLHGDGGRSITTSVRWVMDLTFDLAQLGRSKKPKPVKIIPRWQKPELGRLKINVDASFIEANREGTTALVIRDQDGELRLAQALWYADVSSPLIMEARAIRDAIRLVVDRHFQAVDFETDAKEVIKMMEDPGGGRSEIATICREIKDLTGFIASISIRFVGRLANMAAHACARNASSSRRRCMWVNYKPLFLEHILWKDCNPAS